MISVIIEARGEEHALAITLASLVPAAAEGILRDVIVAEAQASPGVRIVADAAGCTMIVGECNDALALARSDWILLIAPGVRLEDGWFREAAAFMERARRARGGPRAAAFRHAVDEFGLRARLAEIRAVLLSRRWSRRVLLVPKAALTGGRRVKTSSLRSRAFVGRLGAG